jgi:hypothetical protein
MHPRRRASPREDQELHELQEALSALSVRVAEIRNQRFLNAERRHHSNTERRPLSVGDRVYFQLNGHRAEGVIIDQTPHRFRIRHIDRFGDNTGDIYLRSGTTITLIV